MAISLIATAQPASTTSPTSASLNCGAGGAWSVTPSAGDLMLVFVNYGDDSLSPFLDVTPSGWTLIEANNGVDTIVIWNYGLYYRFASASETTYTWTSVAQGQSAGKWQFQGICLRGCAAISPGTSPKDKQADSVTQTTHAIVDPNASSAVVAGWSQTWVTAANYSSVATINGVTPTVIKTTVSGAAIGGDGAFAFAIWLAPGAGTWTPTATRGTGTTPNDWQGSRFGVTAAVASTTPPQRTLVGVGT